MTSSSDEKNKTICDSFDISIQDRPKHIAIIMDGNGRWASNKGLDRTIGHIEGVNSLREILVAAGELRLKVLTVYSFSIENWKRPIDEIESLMNLFLSSLENELPNLIKNNVQLRIIGVKDNLSKEVIDRIREAEEATKNNKGLILCAALNYSSRREIVESFIQIYDKLEQGQLTRADINEELINSHLQTRGLSDPDLLIRTAGEMRLSNYLLWQLSYSEIYITDVLWPDFKKEDLLEAIRAYSNRIRKFGDVKR